MPHHSPLIAALVVGIVLAFAFGMAAHRLRASPQPLARVLQALAAFGMFGVAMHSGVAHTPRSRLLRTDRPNSLHHAARFWTAPGSWMSK